MKFSATQKQAVEGWVADGLKLSDIQSRIQESFGLKLTYMDVRFLIDDLQLQLADQPKRVDGDLRNPPQPKGESVDDAGLEDLPGEPGLDGSTRKVTVSLHRIYKPGSVVSGDVVFSDGRKSGWALDQVGRLTLNPGTEGYKPADEDIQEFQKELSILLQNHGF